MVTNGVTVTVAGANGAANEVFVSLVAFATLNPQADVNATLIVSPAAAAAFELYIITIVCEFTSPESIVPVEPTVPSAGNDQNQPVAGIAVAVAAANADAEYLYFLAPQIFVCTGVTVTVVGASGADSNVFVNFNAFATLLPHTEVYATFTLSPVAAALLFEYVTVMI